MALASYILKLKVQVIGILLLTTLGAKTQPVNPIFTAADSAFFSGYEDTLQVFLDSTVNCSKVDDRIAYNYAVLRRLARALRHPNSFHYPFDSLYGIEIVMSPDSAFRILTWQLELQMKHYRHFGAIQMNSKELVLYDLFDASDAIKNPSMAVLPDSLWFGMLYYNIIKREVDSTSYYFLFGFDENDPISRIKFVDVLTFTDGEPKFGAPMFEVMAKGQPHTVSRFKLQYAKVAVVTLNYFEEYGQMIIFDHVAPHNPNSQGAYFTYLPDGTYEGFKWNGAKWIWVEKVFDETQETPPFPFPVDFDREYERQE